MKFNNLPTIIFSLFLLSGCATVSTSSDYITGTNFSNLKTYDWVSETQPAAGDVRLDNTLTDSRIRKAVESNLAVKGFEKSKTGQPDFLVSYQAAIEGKLDVTTVDIPYSVPSYGAYRGTTTHHNNWAYGGTETFVSQYEEGTVFIDIVNPKTKELMWRGTGKATVLENATPEKREARINNGIKKILSQFPPN